MNGSDLSTVNKMKKCKLVSPEKMGRCELPLINIPAKRRMIKRYLSEFNKRITEHIKTDEGVMQTEILDEVVFPVFGNGFFTHSIKFTDREHFKI